MVKQHSAPCLSKEIKPNSSHPEAAVLHLTVIMLHALKCIFYSLTIEMQLGGNGSLALTLSKAVNNDF